jgi:hypothetical protein
MFKGFTIDKLMIKNVDLFENINKNYLKLEET